MRVITGSARGRKLVTPEGMEVRPTLDKVKEGLFSAIQFEIEGRDVLDLFAGSGQLGIEALSRGAASCVFVDSARKSQHAIQTNIAACGFQAQSKLIAGDALSYIKSCMQSFGI
ncbi:MAG: RsmD family RNA methyltransferase, partial [Oscillospiraceae bacterium]|nr:RsmD family RNA methyltransferase [Oscillospiraceae bacterium]